MRNHAAVHAEPRCSSRSEKQPCRSATFSNKGQTHNASTMRSHGVVARQIYHGQRLLGAHDHYCLLEVKLKLEDICGRNEIESEKHGVE